MKLSIIPFQKNMTLQSNPFQEKPYHEETNVTPVTLSSNL